MTLLEAITARHSVRKYIDKPIPQDIIDILQAKIEECNEIGNLPKIRNYHPIHD